MEANTRRPPLADFAGHFPPLFDPSHPRPFHCRTFGANRRRSIHGVIECGMPPGAEETPRSEEHTSELQSHLNLVCRLLLEKKKNKQCVEHITQRTQTDTRSPPWSAH